MESKKKKKIILIISLVSVFLIAAVIGTLFVVKKINGKSNNNQPATNVSTSIEEKLFEAEKAIIQEKVSANYVGNYKFKSICSLEYHKDLTHAQKVKLAEQYGTRDPNGLLKLLENKKKQEVKLNGEILVFKTAYDDNGKQLGLFTRSTKDTIQKGSFVGNDDLSEVKITKENRTVLTGKNIITFEISKTCINQEIISSPTADDTNPMRNHIYVYRKVYSKNDPNLVLFTVTYIYEMVEYDSPVIPDSSLPFDI